MNKDLYQCLSSLSLFLSLLKKALQWQVPPVRILELIIFPVVLPLSIKNNQRPESQCCFSFFFFLLDTKHILRHNAWDDTGTVQSLLIFSTASLPRPVSS